MERMDVKQKLSMGELVSIASMLFGLFFGAGNLIFPIFMGHAAGDHVWSAALGLLVTGVGLPLLGVAAIGVSRSDGLIELSGKVGRGYSVFFTCALYLTIGPLFAIPRCATVPFTVGVQPMLNEGAQPTVALAVFSALFFAAVLAFSLFPGRILTWVGRILNPAFLVLLGVLVVTALLRPTGSATAAPQGDYLARPFLTGFLDGYNTMDALASLAFGIIVIDVIRGRGIEEPRAVAKNTVKAGVFSCLLMAVIYVAVAVVGAQSRGDFENGGEVFAAVAEHYFGRFGMVVMAVIFTLACLKTAVGLVTSCSETFCKLFPRALSYRVWAVLFSAVSFLIANLGLTAIITYAVPVLMFLYPLAIMLILLGLCGGLFGHSRTVYAFTSFFTLPAALLDLLGALPDDLRAALGLDGFLSAVNRFLPLSDYGLGWVLPAAVGLAVGLLVWRLRGGRRSSIA